MGDVGQMVPAPPAGRVCFRADRSQKRAAKYCGLEAGAEVTLLSRTSVFPFPKNQRTGEIHLIAQMIHLQLGVIVYGNVLLGLKKFKTTISEKHLVSIKCHTDGPQVLFLHFKSSYIFTHFLNTKILI